MNRILTDLKKSTPKKKLMKFTDFIIKIIKGKRLLNCDLR